MAEDTRECYYRLSLSVKHPNMDPAEITRELGLTPTHSWLAGSERRTPVGTRLSGTYANSYWIASRDVVGDRAFFHGMIDMISKLESLSSFLNFVSSTGGTIAMIIGLPGKVNIGDEIATSDLARLVRLNIKLGIEVFPHFEISS